MFFSISSIFFFIVNKISADNFKNEITPSLKANNGLKLDQYVALNRVREKGKPRCKLSYEVLKEEDGYDPLIDIFPYLALIQVKYFPSGILHCVKVAGKWILKVTLLLHFTKLKKICATFSLMIKK